MLKNPQISFFAQELLIICSAVATGLSLQFNWLAAHDWEPMSETFRNFTLRTWDYHHVGLRLWASPLVMVGLFYLLRIGLRRLVGRSLNSFLSSEKYLKYDSLTYLVFLLSGLGFFGVFIEPAALFVAFILVQMTLMFAVANSSKDNSQGPSKDLLGLFFISGFAALIYQVVWQRVLFQSFGVNIESVTIIVSIFMFGLGVGSIIGGYLSKKYVRHQILIFAICEVAIGLFGLFSLQLIDFVTSKTLHGSPAEVAVATYALLFIPTTLMGATLPVLVSYLHRSLKNVGESVSFLYFVNTLGSAIASVATIHILFYLFDLTISIWVAAVFNFAVVYFVWKKFKFVDSTLEAKAAITTMPFSLSDSTRYFFILILSGAIGYISLSQEILWMRFISYTTGGSPTVFGNLLCFFLLGIALGSLWAAKLCRKYEKNLLKIISLVLAISGVLYYLTMPTLGFLATIMGTGAIPLMYLSSGIIALTLGTTFPILTHFTIRDKDSVGLSVSLIYFANVIGSTAGPIVTGFILLDLLSFKDNVRVLSLLTLLAAISVFLVAVKSNKSRALSVVALLGIIGLEFFVHQPVYSNLFERLYFKQKYDSTKKFVTTVENRSGVINILPDKDGGGNTIIGGGQYDGRFNTDLVVDSNTISRAYMIAALHPNPQEVLEIGLSGGAWGTVVSNYPKVQSFDVVEINPGYVDLLSSPSPYENLLKNPKVKLHVDDARRWLLRNPERKFDFILMNTTFHWRSQISNIVSKDFLEICKKHLKPGGVMYYNATDSADIPFTAAHVFQYVSRFRSFVVASDSPFDLSEQQIKENLLLFLQNKELVSNPEDKKLLEKIDTLSKTDFSNRREAILNDAKYTTLITDNNLASEFKTGKKVIFPEKNWLQVFIK